MNNAVDVLRVDLASEIRGISLIGDVTGSSKRNWNTGAIVERLGEVLADVHGEVSDGEVGVQSELEGLAALVVGALDGVALVPV